MISTRTKVKMALSLPIAWIWVLAYKTSSQRDKIDKDLDRFCQVHNGCHPGNRRLYYMLSEFVGDGGEEFRSLFLYRIGKKRHFLKHIMPHGAILLGFDVPRDKLGAGLFIQHGYCTDLSAREIGVNCWINQRVTLGYKGDGCPTIGNNVTIGVGAVVIGDVKIGNNVRIGANAIVVHDVPDNCTVCSPAATIVKRHDPSVNE